MTIISLGLFFFDDWSLLFDYWYTKVRNIKKAQENSMTCAW